MRIIADMAKKIAFYPSYKRGSEIIKILEGMGGVNLYNLDGRFGIYAIEGSNIIANDWDLSYLRKHRYKVYSIEEYEEMMAKAN
jgi:hypothetical protein